MNSPSTPDSLQPYRRFPTLYAERKYTRKFTSPPFRFLDLPPELRVMVYKFALVLPQPIELWPECDIASKSHQNSIIYRNFRYLHLKLNRRHFHVGLLLTCKLINHEARDVFYGCNEWRFSGMNGWMVANAFLYTIGSRNTMSIRSITLPMPFDRGSNPSLLLGSIVPAVSGRAVLRLAKQVPFDLPDTWKHMASFFDVCAVLGKYCTNLQTLNLVLPAWLDYGHADPSRVRTMFDQLADLHHLITTIQGEKMKAMRIRVVKVRKAILAASSTAITLPVVQPQWLTQECATRGWRFVQTTCDKHGRYTVPK